MNHPQIQQIMMISHSKIKSFIDKTAYYTQRKYPRSYLSFYDLVQSGWVCFYNIKNNYCHYRNNRYIYLSIVRAIKKEKIQSIGYLYTPYKLKRKLIAEELNGSTKIN